MWWHKCGIAFKVGCSSWNPLHPFFHSTLKTNKTHWVDLYWMSVQKEWTSQLKLFVNLILLQLRLQQITLSLHCAKREIYAYYFFLSPSFSPQHNTICALTLETVVPFDKMQMSWAVFSSKEHPPTPSWPIPPFSDCLPQWALTAGGWTLSEQLVSAWSLAASRCRGCTHSA